MPSLENTKKNTKEKIIHNPTSQREPQRAFCSARFFKNAIIYKASYPESCLHLSKFPYWGQGCAVREPRPPGSPARPSRVDLLRRLPAQQSKRASWRLPVSALGCPQSWRSGPGTCAPSITHRGDPPPLVAE